MKKNPSSDEQPQEKSDQTRISRKDLASWVEGPPRTNKNEWPGQDLGLPKDGPTRLASFGRRIGAVFIDWMIAWGIALFLARETTWTPLIVFFILTAVQLGLYEATLGKRLLRMQVVQVGGARIKWAKAVLRTFLLCLVVPAFIMDADGRGAHDKIANTVEIAFAPRPKA
ncbi:RDD family protein [Micrococcoides hystricis]|uniref:RDD family protein n=1 Tax=Micrococcoides hystricis TaxID=1572761 RepID=A0ABV6P6U3_9MICC